MAKNKNIIKKVYDQYKPSDFQYGEDSSTTLNPIREINFDQIEIIRRRLQQVTDDIIHKKIIKDLPPEAPIRASFSAGIPDRNSLLRQAAQINTGSIGLGVLFPIIDGPENGLQALLEPKIGTFPSELLLGTFDKPLTLDCKEILRQLGIFGDGGGDGDGDDIEDKDGDEEGSNISDDDDNDDNSGDGDSGSGDGSGDGGDDSSDGEGDDADGEEENEFEACALIELEWLKIILILLRIIKIIQIILDLILAILVPILEIVMLALMCWLIPPAAEQLRQRITEMVIALIIMIITRLLAMIFQLLNLDCISDQTMNMISQIKEAMTAFSSIMSVFKEDSVSMMIGNALDQLKDPLDSIAEMWEQKKEAWDKMKSEWGIGNENFLKDMWDKTKDQIKTGAINSIATDPNIQKAQQTATAAYKFMKNDIMGTISNLKKAKKATMGGGSSKPVEPGKAKSDELLKALGMVEME